MRKRRREAKIDKGERQNNAKRRRAEGEKDNHREVDEQEWVGNVIKVKSVQTRRDKTGEMAIRGQVPRGTEEREALREWGG